MAFLIAAFGCLSVFGIKETYGDITTHKVKGIGEMIRGQGFGGGVELRLVPADGEGLAEEELSDTAKQLLVRLDDFGAVDGSVTYSDNALTVRFPWKDTSDHELADVIERLSEKSYLTFREGEEYDEVTGKPAGETLENIIFSGEDVQNAVPVYTTGSDGQTVCYVKLELGSEAGKRFEEATSRLTGKIISIWMDDTLIAMQSVTNTVSDATAFISGDLTAYEAVEMAEKINAGALLTALSCESAAEFAPTLGDNAWKTATALFIAIVAAAALYMLIRYRASGLAAAIALLGQVFIVIAAVTGFAASIASLPVNASSCAGIAISLLIGIYALILEMRLIADSFDTTRFAREAASAGVKKAAKPIFKLCSAAFVLGLLIMLLFSSTGSATAKLISELLSFSGKSAVSTLYPFGRVLLWGTVGAAIMNVGAFYLMVKSLAGFKKLSAPELYGKKR